MDDPEFGTDAWFRRAADDVWAEETFHQPHKNKSMREAAAEALEWAASQCWGDERPSVGGLTSADRLRAKAREIRGGE